MKTMPSKHEGDLPKTVAVIMTEIPAIALSTGWAYLKTKRRIRKGSKYVMKGLLENGMPKELAHELVNQYESDLSIRRIMKEFGGPFSKSHDR
jgi:hypothetical protein